MSSYRLEIVIAPNNQPKQKPTPFVIASCQQNAANFQAQYNAASNSSFTFVGNLFSGAAAELG
jgi:hypothetical protein